MKKILKSLATLALLAAGFSFVSADRTPIPSSGSGSATSTFGFITATTTNATSTFAGDVYVTGNLRVSGTFFAPVAISAASHIRPSVDNTYDLGSSTSRWANIYAVTLRATTTIITNASTTAITLGTAYTGHTSGSIPFTNSSGILSQANSNLFWDATNFRLGINTASPSVSLAVATGSIAVSEYAWGTATSTSMTVDWKMRNTQNIRISTAGVTITFTNATTTPGQTLKLVVCNAPSGTAGTITWGNPIYWSGGTAPTQTTTANKCDVYSFLSTNATGTAVIFGAASTGF